MVDRTREVIVQLLENIGGRKEVAEYLRRYTGREEQRFAIVAFARDVDVDARAEDVAAALSFLHEVGMCPIVVVRGRSTVLRLTDALESRGCRARPITGGVFAGDGEDVEAIDDTEVLAALRAHALPIITVHASSSVSAVRALAKQIKPQKIVVLDTIGHLRGPAGERIDAINLAEDAPRLDRMLGVGERVRLERFCRLIDQLPHAVSLSVTSPEHLARELFTHRGAGTLIRQGEPVIALSRDVAGSLASLDEPRLRELVFSCFGRELIADYFTTRRCRTVYVTKGYRATAVITDETNLPPYLDKFAVTRDAQGEGLGSTLWRTVRADHDALFWRSRADNPINGWYFEQADGAVRSEKWTVFWYGLSGFDDIEKCTEHALGLPPSLL